MKQSHRLIFNTVIIWVTRLLAVIPQLIILPFVLHRLGEHAYGIYVLAWSLLQVLELAQQGMSSALIKYGSAYLAQDRVNDVNRVVGMACVYSFIVGLIGFCGIVVWTRYFPHYIKVVGAEQSDAALFCFTTIGIMVLAVFPMSPFRGVLYAKQRHDLVAIVDVASQYLKLGLVVLWFVVVGPSLESLMVISVAATIIGNLYILFLAYHRQPGLKNDWRNCNWQTFKALFSFGGVIFLCTLCLVIRETGLKWTMGTLVSVSFVTHIAIMVTPARMLRGIVHAMTLTVMPVASKYDALEDRQILSELFIRGTRYVTLLALCAVFAVFFLLKPILEIWLGPEYTFLNAYIIIIFGAAAFLLTTSCAHHILRGVGKLTIVLLNSIIGNGVLPIGITLLTFVVSGLEHWAITLGLSLSCVVYAFMQLVTCSRAIGVDLPELLVRGYGQALVIAAPMFVALNGVIIYFGIESIPILIASLIIAFAVSAFLFYTIFFAEVEKQLSRKLFRAALNRVPFLDSLKCFYERE